MTGLPFIVGLGIDGALLFSQRGKDEVKQTGLEVPVNLKYTIGLGSLVYLCGGGRFFFDFKKKDYVMTVRRLKWHLIWVPV